MSVKALLSDMAGSAQTNNLPTAFILPEGYEFVDDVKSAFPKAEIVTVPPGEITAERRKLVNSGVVCATTPFVKMFPETSNTYSMCEVYVPHELGYGIVCYVGNDQGMIR